MPPKVSKSSLKFELLGKEIIAFEKNIKNLKNIQTFDESNSRTLDILKSKVVLFENKLENIFSELSQHDADDYFDTYIKHKDLLLNWSIDLENKLPVAVNKSNESPEIKSSMAVQLPKLEVPHFYGNNEMWISFKEIFKSSILDNRGLNDVEKLTYLQSSIKGDASKLIRGFSITSENLTHCWQLLCDRYENKRQLATSQINKIFKMKITKANNSKLLLEIIDICNESIRNLNTLGLENNSLTDLIIINFLITKLDDAVIHRWELTLDNDSVPSLATFKSFIEKEARSTQESKLSKPEFKKMQTKSVNNSIKKSHIHNTVEKKEAVNNEVKNNCCILCKNMHALFKCPRFNSMNVNDRWKVVRDNSLCQNCLRSNHVFDNCRIGFGCKNCGVRHHSLLHIYVVNARESQSQSVSTVANSYTSAQEQNHVLLSTALIKVKSQIGNKITCRALIDNGSQNCLVSKHCAEKLQLSMQKTKHRLVGINEVYAETCLHSTNIEFSPYFSADSFKVNALVVNKVTTSLPNFSMQNQNWPHLNNLCLADPSYFVESEVDILLGADIFLSLVTGSPILGPKGTPSALPTKLGHLLSGSVNTQTNQNSSVVCHTLVNIENTLKNFWELEAIPKPYTPHDEDELCDNIFDKFHTRNSEGRYIVKLPLKENSNLGDSKEGALKRFFALERKLQTNDQLRQNYNQFMEEYQSLGHMTPLTPDLTSPHYFLPHHGVINESSSTTKLRVVFDGSFKTTNRNSLNDILLTGKKLQTDIFAILLKFRSFPVAFSSDITKMYRQIIIASEDRSFQQIFWRKSPNEPIQTYTLNTVTYGTACAPYLAIRTIQQLCNDEKEKFPQAAKLAQDHFYVDDLLAGADSIDSAKILIQELLNLMNSGGFELRKWSCSHPEVIAQLPDSLKASTFTHSFQEDSPQKILGLFWDLTVDSFQVRAVPSDNVSTKRQLLSIIARTFDPLGFVSPSTIILKIILQDVWKANLDWDDPLPSDIIDRWNKFQSEIHYFKEIRIPRYIHVVNSVNIEVHGFCDASIKAYSAAIYLRVIHNSSHIFLIAAKTRVAPVQTVTLPRLELCGAVLLAELVDTFKKSVNFNIHHTYFWCDSTIVLCWINNPPVKGNQFVQHRICKIHALTSKNSWHHIPGKSNPVDCASRGLYPKQLMENSEWLNGPKWLIEFDPTSIALDTLKQESNISSDTQFDSYSESTSLLTQINPFQDLFEKFSSYMKLIRTVAWIFRFYNNSRLHPKTKGPLKAYELDIAIKTIVKLLQNSAFHSEIVQLKSSQSLPKSSKLLALNPFLDKEGILRVGGRLRHQQEFTFDQKHPMLLPKHHHFTILLIKHYHISNLHAGQELVLSLIRQLFWIPDGKSTVRKELRKCLECFKFSAKPMTQLMGDLPSARINPSRAFEKVGIDFAGPISTKCQHTRKSSMFKSYICLFICMCTKALHLEVVSSLSSAAFLAAFRRFVARRGYPSHVFSDNGTNFVGASAYLKGLFKLPHDPLIQDYSSQQNISWQFIPPYAPNFGGIWEASIKLTKTHLLKTCKKALLNFEELTTLLCQIEAIINSRPLYPLSPDSKDLSVLTPGHFLIGCPLLEIPEHQSNHMSLSLASRWSLLLQLKAHFWKQWSTSYLNTLQPRSKWLQGNHLMAVGKLVLLKDPFAPATVWRIGRITATHPGSDGVCRVVTVQTAHGVATRPISQIAVLPIDTDSDSAPPPEDVEYGINHSLTLSAPTRWQHYKTFTQF